TPGRPEADGPALQSCDFNLASATGLLSPHFPRNPNLQGSTCPPDRPATVRMRRFSMINSRLMPFWKSAGSAAALAGAMLLATNAAHAERIANPVAEFTGIDKITGRIITFDVYINETVQFGALQVTPRVCYSRPESEEPKTDPFVEVDEITLDR